MQTPRNDKELSALLDKWFSIYKLENRERILANTYKINYNRIVTLYDIIDWKIQPFWIGIY